MRTITAYFRYDWRRNAARHLALTALAIGSFWVPFIFGLGDGHNHRDEPLFRSVVFSFVGCEIAALLLFVGTALKIGRDGSPRELRHFTHTLPLRRGEWAAGKLLSALVWVGLVPVFGLAVGMGMIRVAATASLWAMPVVVAELALSFLPLSLAFVMWMLLCAALLPNRWVPIGLLPFVVGEVVARGVTSVPGLVSRSAPMWSISKVDAGLLAVLVLALAAILVSYHQRPRLRSVVLAALVALGSIDGARALLW